MDTQAVSEQTTLVGDSARAPLHRYLWCVAAATFLVAVCPIALVWWLRSAAIVTSGAVGVGLAIVLSLGASRAGAGFWKTRTGAGDILFNELMVWGFIRRWRNERRLASARDLLGAVNDGRARSEGRADAQLRALEQLGSRLEATDPHTHGHSRRVARHAWMIAKQLGLRGESVARIRTAAVLHDVGKLHTPAAVLRKPGRLTDAEYEVIKRHPGDGARMVAALGDDELTSIVRHHHERLDGTGYPHRLAGEQIPIGARIIAVADTFDAITSARPYRPTRSHKEALDILKYEAGTQLDPSVVKAFCGIYSGRTPLALWASLTSMPAQAFSWLGGTAVGAASAAQVAAVATLAAVGAVTAPRPVSHQRTSPVAVTASRTVHLASYGTPSLIAAGARSTARAQSRAQARGGRHHNASARQPSGPATGSNAGGHASSPARVISPASSTRPGVGSSNGGSSGGQAPESEGSHGSQAPEAHGPTNGSGQGASPTPTLPPVTGKLPVTGKAPVDTTPVSTTPPVSVTPPVSTTPPSSGGSPELPPTVEHEQPGKPEHPEHPEKPSHPENPGKSSSGLLSGHATGS